MDDLSWTIDAHLERNPEAASAYAGYGEDEKATAGVGLVFDLLVPHLGFASAERHAQFDWGIAVKASVADERVTGTRSLERVKGIEPSSSAWEAAALPLSYTRVWRGR